VTAHKAWAAALVGFLGPILTWVATWLATADQWHWRAFAAAVVGSAISSLAAGGFTWAVPNTPKALPEHSAAGVAMDDVHSRNMEG